ncbi:MAG: hypothetical protein KKB20_19730 [Proteobacteria bacterium]|nr:hypothetical protein [Pseudomonadota bacterium]
MAFWRKWTKDKPPRSEEAGDVLDLSKRITPLVDDTVNQVFHAHARLLIAEPIAYIVPAVWGAAKGVELTEVQREIHARISPAVQEIFKLLDLKDISQQQAFAIAYLIRGLFIAKITYMIEAFKNLADSPEDDPSNRGWLDRTDPAGNA